VQACFFIAWITLAVVQTVSALSGRIRMAASAGLEQLGSMVQAIPIETVHDSEAEHGTAEQVRALLRRYDIPPWLLTRTQISAR
jgi:hypothetical protein